MENRDIFRIYLDSENAEITNDTTGNYTFNIRLPNRKVNYTNYVLYVDDFNICLKGLTISNILLKCNVGQYNSFNSTTKGNNQVIATIFNPQTASGRTDDLSLNYLAPNTPNIITTLPNELVLNITNIDNTAVDMSNLENFFCVNLRIEAFYD